MRHQNAVRNLGRSSSHRRALLRNMVTSLVLHEQCETTVAKAKELKRVADQMVTLGKQGDLHARRQALSYMKSKEAVHKLFAEIAVRFKSRQGGYTRVLRTRTRHGDTADMAIIEFVERAPVVAKSTAPSKESAAKETASKGAAAEAKPTKSKAPKKAAAKSKKA
jgi:large subunit ribosomal protein L17